MKKIYIILGTFFVLINSLIGLIFTSYHTFNWIISDIVIILNVVLLHILSHLKISDGFKVAFSFIFPMIGIISFFISLFMEERLINNISFFGILILTSTQITILIIINLIKVSKNGESI